jgi:hypothetical protein
MKGKIIYHELFPTNNFGNIRVGLELEFNDGEDYDTIYEEARSWVKSKAPTLPTEEEVTSFVAGNTPVPIVAVEKLPPEEERKQQLIADIQGCDTIKELEGWKLFLKMNKDLEPIYNQRHKELSNGH